MRRAVRTDKPPEAPAPPGTGEYSAVSLGSVWGVASLLLFVAALATRQLLGLLPPRLQGYHLMPPMAVRLTPLLALAGALLGAIGARRRSRRTVALLGVGLNVIVVLLSAVFLLGFWWVRLR